MSEAAFKIVLFVAIAWFYIGAILVWRFAIPELYSLLIKKQNVDKAAILAKEQARRKPKK
ncbi:MAG: hypothetical protein JXB06_12935 [Spirochaetales bacterium]|nr:hypothetical protein [Spirochaetales bacterium]